MKSLSTQIKDTLTEKPYWSVSRVAEYLGVKRNVVSVTASRHKIKFMDRRQVEDWIDAKG